MFNTLLIAMLATANVAAPAEPTVQVIYQDFSKICTAGPISDAKIRYIQQTAEREARKARKEGRTVRMIRIINDGSLFRSAWLDGETSVVKGC